MCKASAETINLETVVMTFSIDFLNSAVLSTNRVKVKFIFVDSVN